MALAIIGLCESEIENFHRPVRKNLYIRRLQIPVNDPSLVRRLERRGNLRCDGQRLRRPSKNLILKSSARLRLVDIIGHTVTRFFGSHFRQTPLIFLTFLIGR